MSVFAALVLSGSAYATEPIPFERPITVQVRADHRMCLEPVCGGWYYRDVHHELTECPEGTFENYCYAGAVDFSSLSLTAEQIDRVLNSAEAGNAYLQVKVTNEGHLFGTLEVTGVVRADRVPL